MRFKVKRNGDQAIVKMPARVSPEDTAEFSNDLVQLGADGAKTIVLDLEKTEILDSSVLGALIFARKNIPRDKAEIVLYRAKPYVKHILENAKLIQMFRVAEKEEDL